MGRHREHTTCIKLRIGAPLDQKCVPIRMHLHTRIVVIIEAGTAHLGIIERETKRFDQMQLGPGIGAQTDDVTGIGRNFRLYQNDVKQCNLLGTINDVITWMGYG